MRTNFNNKPGVRLPEYSQYIYNGNTSTPARPSWFSKNQDINNIRRVFSSLQIND